MKWVRASEQLPDKNGDIIFRIIGTTNQVGCSFKSYLGFMLPGGIYRKDYENIEWLYEKEASDKDKEIERLKGLIKEGFVLLQTHWKKTLGQIDQDWKIFQAENNL